MGRDPKLEHLGGRDPKFSAVSIHFADFGKWPRLHMPARMYGSYTPLLDITNVKWVLLFLYKKALATNKPLRLQSRHILNLSAKNASNLYTLYSTHAVAAFEGRNVR